MPSSVIRSFEYDTARNELAVTFTTERTYVYSLVPQAVADAFARAFSKGEFFNQNIRDRYPFRKAGGDQPERSLIDVMKSSL